MDALTGMGYPGKALDFYHAIEPVTNEGIWSQAHELWGPGKETKKAKVRIAERGWHNRESSGGISISQVMLKDFFGFYPEIDGDVLKPNENWQFDEKGLMTERHASINDVEITDSERKFHWPLGRRPDDHAGLSELGL